MPIYEYRCTACNRISEEWVRNFDAPDEQPCEHCGKPAHRIMSHTSFQLKGSGWYVTEYGSHKGAPADSGASAASTSTETSGTSVTSETPASGTSETTASTGTSENSASTSTSESTASSSAAPATTSSDSGKQAAA